RGERRIRHAVEAAPGLAQQGRHVAGSLLARESLAGEHRRLAELLRVREALGAGRKLDVLTGRRGGLFDLRQRRTQPLRLGGAGVALRDELGQLAVDAAEGVVRRAIRRAGIAHEVTAETIESLPLLRRRLQTQL